MTIEAIRSGIDLSHVDPDARPQDDLFGHVNGRWLADYDIPADRATDGAFRYLYDRAEEQVRDLITVASSSGAGPGTDEQRIGDLYASFLDEHAVERRGTQPLLDELTTIDDAADADALAATRALLDRVGERPLPAGELRRASARLRQDIARPGWPGRRECRSRPASGR